MNSLVIVLLGLATVLAIVDAYPQSVQDILKVPELKEVKELPSYVPTCSEKDSNINECIKEGFKKMMPRMRDGIKELNIPPLDPFEMPKASYQYSNGLVQGRIAMKNIKVTGLGDSQIRKVNFVMKDGRVNMDVVSNVPKLHVEGAYKADMRVNDLKLTPKGTYNVSMTDVTMEAKSEGELYESDGHTYLRIKKFTLTPEIGDMRIYATGLSPDPALNALYLDIINQSWRPIYKTLLPETSSTWEPLMLEASNQWLSKTPFDLFVTKN